MNYAKAYAVALKELGWAVTVDPEKVDSVQFDSEVGYCYSEYTAADPAAIFIFRGPDNYYHSVNCHELGTFDFGRVMERAAEVLNEERESH